MVDLIPPTAVMPNCAIPIPTPPVLPSPASRFELLQQWEGTVTARVRDEFVAVMVDQTEPKNPPEEATFPLEEVPDADQRAVVPGAVFYWSIGYETTLDGQKKRVSLLRFRRLPAWSKREIDAIAKEADELWRLVRAAG